MFVLLPSPIPPVRSYMPRELVAVIHLFLINLLQHRTLIPTEHALELLYLKGLSTNTHHLQGEAVQNPSHFLMSAAQHIPHPPERGGGRAPQALIKDPTPSLETPPALRSMTQSKEEPSPLLPHLT